MKKYTKETSDRNKANARKRVVKGKLVDKDDAPKSKREKALAKLRSRKTSKGNKY